MEVATLRRSGAVGPAGAAAAGLDAEVAAARGGDVGAFERLYSAHVGRVHGLCLRMTGDRATAEELTQEAFLRAWQRLPSFRGESAFATWMFRLAANVVISAWRGAGSRRRLEVLTDDVAALDLPAPDGDPEAGLDLERGIASLPRGARVVFVLHDVEGFGHEEIARTTGIAVGTSKAQLHRARRLLREMLR